MNSALQLFRVLAFPLVLTWLASCSSPSQSSAPGTASPSLAGSSTSTTSGKSGPSQVISASNADATVPQTPALVATGAPTPNDWCVAAAKQAIVQNPKHAAQFSQLCSGGKATKLFSTTLVNTAYNGSNTPTQIAINQMADNNGSVTAFFGAGIRLPITSAKQFTAVAPLQGSQANLIATIQAQGQTPGNCSVTQDQTNGDPGWVQGWNIHSVSSETVVLLTVTTDYTSRTDDYKIGNGLYMYVSTLISAVSTIQDSETLTVGIDLNGTGYLLTVAQMQINDRGLPDTAESQLSDLITAFIKYEYSNSVGK